MFCSCCVTESFFFFFFSVDVTDLQSITKSCMKRCCLCCVVTAASCSLGIFQLPLLEFLLHNVSSVQRDKERGSKPQGFKFLSKHTVAAVWEEVSVGWRGGGRRGTERSRVKLGWSLSKDAACVCSCEVVDDSLERLWFLVSDQVPSDSRCCCRRVSEF